MTDEQQFRQLIYRHRDLIWSLCSSYRLSPAWEVQDAFSEVLCELWRCRAQFEGRSSERTWVFRVATSTLLGLKRRRSNQPTDAAEPPDLTVPDDDGYRHLLQLIQSLGSPDSDIVMAHFYGFSYAEIAQLTGLSAPAVSMRLSRARRRIRNMLNNS